MLLVAWAEETQQARVRWCRTVAGVLQLKRMSQGEGGLLHDTHMVLLCGNRVRPGRIVGSRLGRLILERKKGR
jgi:hypothetical protein